jgi:alpha-tubulin suppressor-like RCC1 family protein
MRIPGKMIKDISGITRSNKNLTPNPTDGNGSGTGITISTTPSADGYVGVLVNGLQQALGDGNSASECYFVNAAVFGAIKGSGNCSIGRRTDGTVWTWGNNTAGQLGDNTVDDKSSPVSIVGAHSFTLIGNGAGNGTSVHVIAMKSDGTAWCWGQNTNGQLGDNTAASKSSPVSVVGTHSFIRVNAGDLNSFAFKSDGSAWAWGNNTGGTLGDNSATARSSPVSVVGTHSFIQIDGGVSGLGRKSDGTVWMWGDNANAALGQNNVTNRSSPVSVVGDHSFRFATIGRNHVLAIKPDGTLWGWGNNASGQLGDNTTATRSSPVSIVGAHSFIFVAGSQNHSIGLKFDGSVWGWGQNAGGQLGDNTVVSKLSPVSVVGAHSFIAVTTGGVDVTNAHSLGIKFDGSVWAWGNNADGQLGDNTVTLRSSPVSVIGSSHGTIRAITDIISGDKLIWNGDLSGFDLDSNDRIDLNYI